jgi:hypothetical protein
MRLRRVSLPCLGAVVTGVPAHEAEEGLLAFSGGGAEGPTFL